MYGGELPLKNDEYINDGNDPIEENKLDTDSGADTNSTSEMTDDSADTLDSVAQPSLSGLEEYGETVAFIDEDLVAYHNADNQEESDDPFMQTLDAINADEEAPEDTESGENDGDDENESVDGEDGDENKSDDAQGDEAEVKEDEPKPRRVDAIFDFIEIAVFSIIGVFLLLSFFFRYTIVDGGSMKNTLQHGDKLLLASFLYKPECGDIVVIQDKSTNLKDPIVKRIIAVGGQTVTFTRYAVYVDGVELEEPYVYTGDYEDIYGQPEAYRYNVFPHDSLLEYVVEDNDETRYTVTVPEGMIFVMGDHRNNSKDSREIGMIHEDAIIGKAIYRFFPFESFGKID